MDLPKEIPRVELVKEELDLHQHISEKIASHLHKDVKGMCDRLGLGRVSDFYGVTSVSADDFEKIATPFAQQGGGMVLGNNFTVVFQTLKDIWLTAKTRATQVENFPVCKIEGRMLKPVLLK